MKKLSFRLRIVGTIIIVVSISSFISITFFSHILKDKLLSHTEETFSQINLLKDQYYFTITQHDGRVIRNMLKESEKDKNVLRTFLVNAKSKVIFPENSKALYPDSAIIKELYRGQKNISMKTYADEFVPYYRVFIKLHNRHSCNACHSRVQNNLGMIVMDVSSNETKGILNFARQFGIYYTLFILLCITALVAYLHYKFIRQSLSQFKSKITLINEGNLSTRLEIPEVSELGNLGKSFNDMVDTFEKTQIELQKYHKKELKQSEKLATIGEMSARIAHEIRNPITGISQAMEIIMSEMKDAENKPILEEIQRQAKRVNQAISNLLKFSQSKELLLVSGDINKVINSIVFFLENQAHNKIINLKLDLCNECPPIRFDHELIENVLLNLSINAIQAIPEDGTIKYSTRYDAEAKMVIISISDNGGGISPDVGKEIFKPFFTTRTQGTGLGLPISKDIVERHGGDLWYENNKDSGCTFFVSLPE